MSEPSGSSDPRHGGDLDNATRTYGLPPGGWLDLSTGINPTPYPVPPLSGSALARLPDKAELWRLIDIARRVYRVPAGVELVAVPGTELAIRLIPQLAPAGRVSIAGPTYGSHAEAWKLSGRDVTQAGDTDIGVVVNPNNPDGRIIQPADVLERARRCRLLVVDEAFADASPEASVTPAMGGAGPLVVLRSLGKFYGLAGVRLGFVAAAPEFARRLAALLGDWPVSGPALAAGVSALGDDAWRAGMIRSLAVARDTLVDLLRGHGLDIAGSTALFVLAASDDAAGLHRRLAERGVWTRRFAEHPRWLRFGLPGAEGMPRLEAALRASG